MWSRDVSSTLPSCQSSPSSARPLGRSAGQTTTAFETVFSTSTRPWLSRIGPRGASTEIVRTWLFCAACRYCVAASTWSAQSRRKRMPKATSATAPTIATRRAIFGVSRYGSSTRGSGGRKRGMRERGPQCYAGAPCTAQPRGARKQAPDDGVDRHGQQQVEGDALEERVEQDDAGRRRLAEDEAERQAPERVEEGDDRDREERRVGAVAAGGLAVAPDPVAGQRQQQRGEPERLEGRRVDDEAREESGAGSGHGTAQQRDGDERDEQEVGRAAEDLDVREDRDLEDRGEEDEPAALTRRRHQLGPAGSWRGRTCTATRRSRRTA